GLDGGNVWIDEDGVDALFLESLDGLRARVVEFTSLANAQASTAKNKNLLQLASQARIDLFVLGKSSARNLDGLREVDFTARRRSLLDGVDKHVKEEFGIPGAGGAFGVELDRKLRL